MKKIKTQLKKTPIKGTVHLALLILAEQRHKMLKLMLDWYRDIATSLEGEVKLTLHVASRRDPELTAALESYEGVHYAEVSDGVPHGERNNQALMGLKAREAHGVLALQPGDLLSASLLRAHAAQLKEGALFSGLLDTYLYDPTEFKFMYWAQHRYESHPSRVAPIGFVISRGILDALKWRLWPNQVKPADGFHKPVLERLSQAFKRAPQGSCVSQTMEVLGGVAISLKSELARALYEEGNWQKLNGLSYESFESKAEGHLSESWVSRLNEFDERIKVELLVDAPPEGESAMWQTHYNFCVYKFLPYADVRLRLISSDESLSAPSGWSKLSCSGGQHERHQQALSQLKDEGGDLVLFAGQGGLIDLKTMEHYLIHVTKQGARYLAVHNFFVADPETHTISFWPGVTSGAFTEMIGFGSCIHRSYLDQISWELFDSDGVKPEAARALEALASSDETRHQTVFFKCVTHKLGMIAMGSEGLLGFEDKVRLTELKRVHLGVIPEESFDGDMKLKLSHWTQGIELTAPSAQASAAGPFSQVTETTQEHNMSEMSPLERAKALLAKKSSAPQAEAPTPAPEAPALSPLERAKALLAQSQGGGATPQPEAPAATPIASQGDEQAQMSPLERAKALLAQAERVEAPREPDPKEAIDSAIQNAEQVIAQLTAQRDAALKAVQEASANQGRVENPASALLCEQGEQAFGEGELEKAGQLFESALLIDVDSTRALSNLGVVSMQREEPWKALSYLLVALIKDHEDENVVANLQGLLGAYPELKVAQSLFG